MLHFLYSETNEEKTMRRKIVWAVSFCCLLVGTVLTTSAEASKLADTTWQVTLDTGSLGPIEFYLHMAERDGALYAHSNSAALDLLRALPVHRAKRWICVMDFFRLY